MEDVSREERQETGVRFGPFRYLSDIDLTELGLARNVGGRAVFVRRGRPPEGLNLRPVVSGVSAGPAGSALRVPGLAVFTVVGGDTVWVEEEPGANAADLRGYLTAWVFGALCHGNGLLPLHASAVERGGVAAAFCGESGAGKSTLAAYLEGRGGRVLADDICLLDGDRVVPVASWMKLWRGSLEALGMPVDEGERTFSDEDKYRVRLTEGAPDGLTLRHVVFPERGEVVALEQLSATEALARMVGALYLPYLVEPMGTEARVLEQCAQVLQGAVAWGLRVPWGFDRLGEVAAVVEERLLSRG